MIVRPGRPANVYRYWRAELRAARGPSVETPARIIDVMRDSVAVHLRSDAPVGAFLSGGIDSAALCALAAEHQPGLLTFTVGFAQDGYSEIDQAQQTAAAVGGMDTDGADPGEGADRRGLPRRRREGQVQADVAGVGDEASVIHGDPGSIGFDACRPPLVCLLRFRVVGRGVEEGNSHRLDEGHLLPGA
jgi:hypothetical protein